VDVSPEKASRKHGVAGGVELPMLEAHYATHTVQAADILMWMHRFLASSYGVEDCMSSTVLLTRIVCIEAKR
jgi:hypothetical protein